MVIANWTRGDLPFMTRERIACVDDDRDHLLISKTILERSGYDVLTLSETTNLIERLSHFGPSLIFMDHNMPKLTGIQATRVLKNHPLLKNVPVIYLSSREDIEKVAAEAGADGWVPKTAKTVEFLASVRSHLHIVNDAGD